MSKKPILLNCKFCGTKLPDRYKGRAREYCNVDCRNKYYKKN